MEFKDALRRRRESLGLTPDDVARRLTRYGAPTTSADVQLWERGRNTPPLDSPVFIQALSAALQTPVESIQRVRRIIEPVPEYGPEAGRAAELIDQLPPQARLLAISLLETLVRHFADSAMRRSDFWED